MPLVRWLQKADFDQIYDRMDDELKELCEEIRQLTGEEYAVQENTYYNRSGFWPFKTISKPVYVVLYWLGKGEVQCINLMSGSFCGECSRNEAGAFLLGLLNRKEGSRERQHTGN